MGSSRTYSSLYQVVVNERRVRGLTSQKAITSLFQYLYKRICYVSSNLSLSGRSHVGPLFTTQE